MALPAFLEEATPPRLTVKLCFRPDLLVEYQQLERGRPKDSLSDKTAARKEELEQEMRDATVPFVLQALPRPRWTALIAEHPPVKGNKEQEAVGYNAEAFHAALLRESIVEPELDDEAWAKLDQVLTAGHFQRLWSEAQALNISSFDLPFA